jgi:hypothetical protein
LFHISSADEQFMMCSIGWSPIVVAITFCAKASALFHAATAFWYSLIICLFDPAQGRHKEPPALFRFVKVFQNTLTGKKNGTLISQQQIIPIIPILMYFDQEAMIANITLHISIGYFISNFA